MVLSRCQGQPYLGNYLAEFARLFSSLLRSQFRLDTEAAGGFNQCAASQAIRAAIHESVLCLRQFLVVSCRLQTLRGLSR